LGSSKVARTLVVLTLGLAVAAVALQAAVASKSKQQSRNLLVGIFDEGQTLYGDHSYSFPVLQELHTQVLRTNMYWGGKYGVANTRPGNPSNPEDPAYDWTLYDALVGDATKYGMKVVFSIYRTPAWAGGGARGNVAPKNPIDLQRFALAAAKRYPQVKFWLAWNEPNNPVYLTPQYKRVAGKWVVWSGLKYAGICNAVVKGVHAAKTSAKVGCGVTDPNGNNAPATSRPSVSPLVFINAMKRYGAKGFDAYAHHPYPQRPVETPRSKPTSRSSVTLYNINTLIALVTKNWGRKPIWITEYGYQTNPPDKFAGVSWAKQASYLKQAFAIARANPRIQMMLWFLFQDDVYRPRGFDWQSGLITQTGTRKPSFNAFKSLVQK